MTREQLLWTSDSGLKHITNNGLGEKASLVLAFGARVVVEDSAHYNALKSNQPNAKILLTSTAGEIQNDEVTKGYNFELHLDGKFLHYRAATNWHSNWRDSEDPLTKKTKIFNMIIGELLK